MFGGVKYITLELGWEADCLMECGYVVEQVLKGGSRAPGGRCRNLLPAFF